MKPLHASNANNYPLQRRYLLNPWTLVSIFILILVFQPSNLTFHAVRPSDLWLWMCLFVQYNNKTKKKTKIIGTSFIGRYGLYMGALAIFSTLVQAIYAGIELEYSFLFHFYRFFRYVLIFIFIKNVFCSSDSAGLEKLLKFYSIMGCVVVFFGFLEYRAIQPFQMILVGLYSEVSLSTLEDYLGGFVRLFGVFGNPNATAIFIITTVVSPLFYALLLGKSWKYKLVNTLFVFVSLYALVVMLGSRTALLAFVAVFLLIGVASLNSAKNTFIFGLSVLLFCGLVYFSYGKYQEEFVVQDRILTAILDSKNQLTTFGGIAVWTGRNELWTDRLQVLDEKGSFLAPIIGLGYTKKYKDYADNGLLSAYINNGLIGLFLKLVLYYYSIVYVFARIIKGYRDNKYGIPELSSGLIVFVLMFWDLTADMTEHYKIGQLFYVFLSISILMSCTRSRT